MRAATANTQPNHSTEDFDDCISFHNDDQIMEIDFRDLHFGNSTDINAFYDRVEDRIAATGEPLWFFLVNYANARIDPQAWLAHSRRGKALNMAHSMGTVRFDASDITRAQIERDAGTDAFDPNLFADRDSAFARLHDLPSQRQAPIVHVPSYTRDDFIGRVRFLDTEQIMDIDFTGLHFQHSRDVNDIYDYLEEKVTPTDQKWYFLINYDDCRIMSAAWVQYAARGKVLNQKWSLGSVRYAPGSETETDIRMRSDSQGFRPNIRNTREEAIEAIQEMKAQN